MTDRKKRWDRLLSVAITLLLLACVVYVGREAAAYVAGSSVEAQEEGRRVVIDAGHGGDDPGKVGINGANEKDVNLEIARLVKQYLEMSDVEVVMTDRKSVV